MNIFISVNADLIYSKSTEKECILNQLGYQS